MAIGDDFSITENAGDYDIRHESGATTYTYLELHRWLGDLSDNASVTGDDEFDITIPKLCERSTDQIFALLNGANIDDTAAEYLYDGSITQAGGDDMYSGLEIVGAVEAGTQPVIIQNNTILTDYWGAGLNAVAAENIIMRISLKTRSGGVDIDGKRIRVRALELGDSYAYFDVTLGEGVSVAALFTSADTNNETAEGVISGWTDVTSASGLQLIDLNNGNGDKEYLDEWDFASRTEAQFYERTKWLQRRGTSASIHGMDGQLYLGITHYFAYDNEQVSEFVENEILSWGTGGTAGTGILLALDDDGDTGNMYIQLLAGVICTDGLQITGTSTATCDVDGSVTSVSAPANFIGQYTGSGIIGAFGVGIEAADLVVSDKIYPLDGTEQQPPNNQSGVVGGLTSGEDYILVVESTGEGLTTFKYNQMLSSTGNDSGDPDFVVQSAISSDTPSSGKIRAWNGTSYDRLEYTSWTGSTFTINGTLPNTYTNGENAFISYIDKSAGASSESFTAVYGSDKYMAVLVRDGGSSPKKEFLAPATFSSGGFSITDTAIADE